MLLRVACCMLLRDTQVVIRHEDCQVERSTTSNNVPLFASFSKSIAGLKLLCSLTELPKAESKIPCLLYNVISEAYSAHFNAGRNCFVSCTQAVPYSWTCRRPGQPSICVVQRVPHYAAQHNTYLPWKAIAARCRNILVRPFLRGKAPVRVDQRPHVCKLRSRCALGHNCTGPSLPDPCTKLRAIRLLLVQKTHCPKAACANHTARQNALGTPSGSLCRPKCQAACTGQHNEGLLAVQHFPS